MKTLTYVPVFLLCSMLTLQPVLAAVTGDFYTGSACAQNTAGGLCTNAQTTIIKVPSKNKPPEYMNSMPSPLLPKLKVVPAPTPVFNQGSESGH